jgi:hypothetical protein
LLQQQQHQGSAQPLQQQQQQQQQLNPAVVPRTPIPSLQAPGLILGPVGQTPMWLQAPPQRQVPLVPAQLQNNIGSQVAALLASLQPGSESAGQLPGLGPQQLDASMPGSAAAWPRQLGVPSAPILTAAGGGLGGAAGFGADWAVGGGSAGGADFGTAAMGLGTASLALGSRPVNKPCKLCGRESQLSCGMCDGEPPYIPTYYCTPAHQQADFTEHRKYHESVRAERAQAAAVRAAAATGTS